MNTRQIIKLITDDGWFEIKTRGLAMSRRMTSFKNMKETQHTQHMDAYVIVLAKSKKNYSALSPDVPGCYTVGDTVEETLKHMREALAFHLEDEDEVPEPKGLEYHLRHDAELRDGRFIFAYIPVSEIAPLAFA